MLDENFGDFGLVVKWGVVHDDKALRPERGQQHLLDPCCHRQMGATCLEQHGRDPIWPALRHDEVGSFMVVAGDFTKDLVAPGCPAMRPVNRGLEATLIKVHDIFPTVLGNPSAQLAQERDSFLVTTFRIPGRFFW